MADILCNDIFNMGNSIYRKKLQWRKAKQMKQRQVTEKNSWSGQYIREWMPVDRSFWSSWDSCQSPSTRRSGCSACSLTPHLSQISVNTAVPESKPHPQRDATGEYPALFWRLPYYEKWPQCSEDHLPYYEDLTRFWRPTALRWRPDSQTLLNT